MSKLALQIQELAENWTNESELRFISHHKEKEDEETTCIAVECEDFGLFLGFFAHLMKNFPVNDKDDNAFKLKCANIQFVFPLQERNGRVLVSWSNIHMDGEDDEWQFGVGGMKKANASA